jgi:hypothetical protein
VFTYPQLGIKERARIQKYIQKKNKRNRQQKGEARNKCQKEIKGEIGDSLDVVDFIIAQLQDFIKTVVVGINGQCFVGTFIKRGIGKYLFTRQKGVYEHIFHLFGKMVVTPCIDDQRINIVFQ